MGLLGAGLASACAPERVTRRGGDPIEGGIGGTGIVGVLTDEARFLVNGRGIEVTPRTRFELVTERAGRGAVGLGHALVIEAEVRAGRVIASRVRNAYPLVGLLESGDGLGVNGVAVEPEPGAILRAAPGERVAVAGLWRGDRVIATRIDPAGAIEGDVLAGVADDVPRDASGGAPPRIGGTPLALPPGVQAPARGTFATLRGTYRDGAFEVARIERGRFPGLSDFRQLSIEGYLEERAVAPGFVLSGLGHSFDRRARVGRLAGARAVIEGPYREAFRASLGLPLPTDFADRRELLADRAAPGVRTLDLRQG